MDYVRLNGEVIEKEVRRQILVSEDATHFRSRQVNDLWALDLKKPLHLALPREVEIPTARQNEVCKSQPL
jgi:hypothetical protein